MATEEKWYQATLWVWTRKQDGERIPMGPPRRMIEDILLDIRRNKERMTQQYVSKFETSVMGAGATVLWPSLDRPWIREENLALGHV